MKQAINIVKGMLEESKIRLNESRYESTYKNYDIIVVEVNTLNRVISKLEEVTP